MKLIPVVMSGGSGVRLWPVSRSAFPKQFCHLLDDSLQTLTLKRLSRYEPAVIITSEKLKVLTEREIADQGFNVRQVIYETAGKNTAPAVALACRYLELAGLADQVCGVFSSDALITKEVAFQEAIEVAIKSAENDKIVVLGIHPDRIETGFGYIQVQNAKLNQVSEVLKFHEKPNFETAKNFVEDGNFFWNAGIFIFKAEKMIFHLKKHQPEMWDFVSQLKADLSNIHDVYSRIESISIDYAVIEKLKSEDLSCVPCDIGWSDLGSWDVLEQINTQGKTQLDISQKPFEVGSAGNTVFSEIKKVYGTVGVQDLIIVDTADALLICKKGDSQKIKDLVENIKKSNQKVVSEHQFEIRPWGGFEVLREEKHFKSKIIQVEAGQRISYQSHAKRSEHWILVRGEATVVLNDQEHNLKCGQHIYIPQGSKHRIINNSKEKVEFVEVQTGTYFGEDDIVRYQDDYGR